LRTNLVPVLYHCSNPSGYYRDSLLHLKYTWLTWCWLAFSRFLKQHLRWPLRCFHLRSGIFMASH